MMCDGSTGNMCVNALVSCSLARWCGEAEGLEIGSRKTEADTTNTTTQHIRHIQGTSVNTN